MRLSNVVRHLITLVRARVPRRPPSAVDLGGLRRLTPVSSTFGYDRGTPIRRHFIEAFLREHAADVRGRVLEIGDDQYTRAYGGGRVTRSDVLHVAPGNPRATIVADLTRADAIESNSFDCVILTQTLHVIYDVRAALTEVRRILRPGGVLLATLPTITQVSQHDMESWGDYWRFTSLAAGRLFGELFPAENLEVRGWGNILIAIASLHGLAAQELSAAELAHYDPTYEVMVAVRAVKTAG